MPLPAPYYSRDGITIYCADCLAILPELPSGSVDAVVSDLPYGLNFPYAEYDDTRENLIRIIDRVMPLLMGSFDRTVILCGPTQINLYPQAEWVGCITWNTTGTFGKYGYNQWTPVLLYGKDLAGFGNVNGIMKGDTIRISGGGGVGFMRGLDEVEHTCPKPITMMDAVVRRYTSDGSTILDPFLGSGTTAVACIKTGRKCIGIEISEKYAEVAARRCEQAFQDQGLFRQRDAVSDQEHCLPGL